MVDTTTVKEILQQCHEHDVEDRQGTLIRGVTVLKPEMTVIEAGMEEEAEICLLWSDPFVEMARWTREKIVFWEPSFVERWTGQELDVQIPPETASIEAFSGCEALVKLLIPNSATRIGALAFAAAPETSQHPRLCDQH